MPLKGLGFLLDVNPGRRRGLASLWAIICRAYIPSRFGRDPEEEEC